MLRSLLAHKFEAVAIEQPFVFGVGQDLGLNEPSNLVVIQMGELELTCIKP